MSPWLTLVIGVILGLLIGWVIELFYRRRQSAAGPEPVETRTTPLDWAAPPEAAATPFEPETPEALAEPELPAPPEPPTPVEPPQLLEAAVLPAAPEPLVELDRSQPVDSPGLFEPASGATLGVPTAPEPLVELNRSQPVDSPTLFDAASGPAPEAPAVEAHIADELPVGGQGLPAEAIDALTPSVVEGERATAPIQTTEGRDKLIIIEGIGPVYERKLNAAGINTFRQLIATSEDQLREVIQPQSWQRVNFAEWIEQAQLIVEGRDEELRALQARLFSRKKE